MATQNLKNNFEIIKRKRLNIEKNFKEIKYKINELDLLYKHYINSENPKDKNIGFDSFQFQNKLVVISWFYFHFTIVLNQAYVASLLKTT